MALGIALFSTLGFWQLGRAAEKQALFDAFASGADEPAQPGLPADADARERRYGRLRLEGRYDAAHQVLLDNMPEAGRPGYHVLTPLQTPAGAVLVNRGWVPAPGDRDQLPDVAVSGEPRVLTGRIDRLPRPGLKLAAEPVSPSAPWPRRLFFPDAATVAVQLGYPLREYQLLLDPGEADGFRRQWMPDDFGPETHVGYAVQWFGLAITTVVLWLVLALRRPRKAIP